MVDAVGNLQWKLDAELAEVGQRFVLHPLGERLDRSARIGHLPRQHHEEADAQRVDVAGGGGRLAVKQLGRHVVRGADE